MRNAESLTYCFIRQQEQSVLLEQGSLTSLRQYEPDFDTFNYTNFNKLSFLDANLRQQEREKLDTYTRTNLETMLGERFHVLLSARTDVIRDGRLYAPYSQEPMGQMFLRGREYRRENGSLPSDQEREAAEVESFFAIEQQLTHPDTSEGTMFIVISRPGKEGTEYLHNFYDIYTKQRGAVDYRRYSSALSNKETFEKVLQLDPAFALRERTDDPAFLPDDVYFLRHPIRITSKAAVHPTPDDVHAFLHTNHGYMSKMAFEQVVLSVTPYIDAYVAVVAGSPSDIRMRNLAYNAILNRADQVATELSQAVTEAETVAVVFRHLREAQPTVSDLVRLGTQPVREVMTGCGNSGGMSVAEILNQNPLRDVVRSAFGVVNFAAMQLSGDTGYSFDQEGDCVTCGNKGTQVGPCGICEICDRAIRRQQGMQVPSTMS